MALKYVGRARTFNFEGVLYAHPDEYRRHPDFYDHSYDTPIKGLSKERALRMAAESNLHQFEEVSTGENILEQATTPSNVDLTTIKPGGLEKDQARQEKEAEKAEKGTN